MQLAFETVTGAALLPHVAALSRLRASVFREWPYLYDADALEEAKYMAQYVADPSAAIVLARAGRQVVGAASCQAMARTHDEVRRAFRAAGEDPARWCYLGESVLLPQWRGQGAGVAFFAAREAHARALGLDRAAFCAVRRAADDPRRPPGHVPLDAFWRKRGYAPRPGLACVFEWRELGAAGETPHTLDFWTRTLG